MKDIRQIASVVQLLIREKRNIAFVFAELTRDVMDLINGKAITFLQRAVPWELGPINEAEVAISMQESFEESGSSVTGDPLAFLTSVTEGYPYLIQLAGSYVWETSWRHRERSTDVGGLMSSLEAPLRRHGFTKVF